jgi:hypothetical protein
MKITTEQQPKETIEMCMSRMVGLVNGNRDISGYCVVEAQMHGITVAAWGIQQAYNGHRAQQIRWYVNGINLAKSAIAAHIRANGKSSDSDGGL